MIIGAIIGGLAGFILGRVYQEGARRRFVASLMPRDPVDYLDDDMGRGWDHDFHTPGGNL